MQHVLPPSTFEVPYPGGYPKLPPKFSGTSCSALTPIPQFSAPTVTPVSHFEPPTSTRPEVDLGRLQQCLRDVLRDFTYEWPVSFQDRELDALTNFIYAERRWWALEARLAVWQDLPRYRTLLRYARVRWINYWSAMGVETMLSESRCVTLNPDPRDAEWDFLFTSGGFEAQFDHKTTCWPGAWRGRVEDAIRDPRPLVEWLYANQRRQSPRCQANNRLFVILHASDGLHWNLKGEMDLIRPCVRQWLRDPHSFELTLRTGQTVRAAAIIVKE